MMARPPDFPPQKRNLPAMAKSSTRKKPAPASKLLAKLGTLPEWDLNDLYSGLDSPELKRDLALADAECLAFEQDFKGRLPGLAAGEGAGRALVEVVKRYEALEDRLGRLISYASLVYAGNSTDPVRAKFYGDVQERITAASIHLLFFTLELNRIVDAVEFEREEQQVDRGRGDALLHVAIELGAHRIGAVAGIDQRGIGDQPAEPVLQRLVTLDHLDQRASGALARGKPRQPALEILLEGQAFGVSQRQVALEFGAVEPGIEVVEVPFRQGAEFGAELGRGGRLLAVSY